MTVFVDTNVLVYSRDSREPDKQQAAMRWLEVLWSQKAGRLSYQVLQEFYVTVTHKLQPGLSPDEARDDVRSLLVWKPIAIGDRVLEHAWSVQDRYRLSWWDSLIVSAAQIGGSRCLLSEDLQTGQDFDGLKVISPFETDPLANFPDPSAH